jgi:hypothetical protein
VLEACDGNDIKMCDEFKKWCKEHINAGEAYYWTAIETGEIFKCFSNELKMKDAVKALAQRNLECGGYLNIEDVAAMCECTSNELVKKDIVLFCSCVCNDGDREAILAQFANSITRSEVADMPFNTKKMWKEGGLDSDSDDNNNSNSGGEDGGNYDGPPPPGMGRGRGGPPPGGMPGSGGGPPPGGMPGFGGGMPGFGGGGGMPGFGGGGGMPGFGEGMPGMNPMGGKASAGFFGGSGGGGGGSGSDDDDDDGDGFAAADFGEDGFGSDDD